MAVDGSITIGIGANTDKFDKQIMALEKRIKKQEDKKITLDVKMEMRTDELDNARQKYKELLKDHKELVNLQNMPHKTVGQMTRMQELQNQYGSVEKLNEKIEQAYTKQEKAKIKVQEIQRQYELINKEVDEYKQKIENVKIQKQVADVEKLKSGFNSVGSSIQSAVSKVGRLALGIFGIRSAFMVLKRASSNLASYDEQYATDLEYIKFALTEAIAPILRYIVNLAGTLLGYINAIAQAWFGVNLFANGSAEAFNKMKAGAKGTSKAIKEIKKQLLGFDEINMLTDQSDTGTSAGAGGVGMPSFNLAQDVELPDWLKNNRDIILGKGALDAFADTIDMLTEKGIPALGSLKALSGIIDVIRKNGLQGTGALDAFAEMIDMLTKKGFPAIGSLKVLSNIIELNANKSIKSLINAERDLKKATEELTNAQDIYVNAIDRAENAQKKLTEAQNRTGLSGEELYEQVKQGTLDYKNMTQQQKEVYKAYLETQSAEENLRNATEKLTEAKRNEKIASLENQLAVANEKKEFNEYKKAVIDAFEKGEISSEEARQLISKSMSAMSEDARKTFIEDLPDSIKEGLDIKNYNQNLENLKNAFLGVFSGIGINVGNVLGNTIGGALRGAINAALSIIEAKINGAIRTINSFISRINNSVLAKVFGGIGTIGAVYLPRLKTGGIINMPNTGTIVGSAIAGESGREGVVPLTDQQAMAELGREIGRYITVNANIVNTMNGRVISKELKQIQNEQDFAYNT